MIADNPEVWYNSGISKKQVKASKELSQNSLDRWRTEDECEEGRMIYFYLICFLISLILVVGFICSDEGHSLYQNLLPIIAMVANGGYLALAAANNLEEAILANKISYVGGCFLPMTCFIVICGICKIEIKGIVRYIMHTVQMVLFLCVCTIGYYDIYYQCVEYHVQNGLAYLTRTYGPMHMLYVLTMYGYMFACVVVGVCSLFRRTVVSYKSSFIILAAFVFALAGYVAEHIFHWELEIMPVCYTILFIGVLFPIHRINTYDVSENLKKVDDDKGYISFDGKLRYMGCNDFVLDIFPEMAGYALDGEIPMDDSLFCHEVLPLIKEYAQGDKMDNRMVAIGEQTYEIKMSPILTNKVKILGYMLEISDVTDRQKYISMVENYNKDLESEVAEKTHRIRRIQDKMVLGIAQMVESRDLSTGGHIKRTSSVVSVFAKELLQSDMGFTKEFLYYVEKGAPMHDLGKIAVDDQILRKQGKFTDEEYTKMKEHSAAGAEIVRNILTGIEDEQFVRIAVNVAHYHHEKVDGTGYPEGLKGEEIPVEARIMALADVFDALVSKRCYKEAFTFDKAFSIITESAGKHFDTELTEIFLRCRPKLEDLYRSFEADA